MMILSLSSIVFACLQLAASQISSCPGYQASNVQEIDGTLTADLSLAGDACNVHGTDLPNLRLLVEYQIGKLMNQC